MNSWIEVMALIVSGLLVGFINTLAGGGTIINISLLIFLGYPIDVANGTNRIAVFFQTLVAVISFARQKILDLKKGLLLSVFPVIGSILGAFVAAKFDTGWLEKSIAFSLIIMLFFILYKPDRWLKSRPELQNRKMPLYLMLIYFLIGFYGGFIHIGVGFFMLAALVLSSGYDLVHANAIKNLMVLAYSPFSLAVFAYYDLIDYKAGLIMAIGNIIGAWIASRYAVKFGSRFIRWVLVVFIIITVFQLLGFLDFRHLF